MAKNELVVENGTRDKKRDSGADLGHLSTVDDVIEPDHTEPKYA